ncbi:Ubiquitin carboxyl-terminal hydrolase 1 [Eumeta japonica]|uniref:Ubiquitin carboxyl-terminal hydrolase 1 n=1 Tax=Eumeta variegata TaxID=151549 RepID=A0A4C1X837_EUMVA|nr:Ubiquitin carboxyl-terminal hydrolase 1 [Eumeta japonica]
MPVNSLCENKKETDKPKFRLSLNKKNVSILSNGNRKVNEETKENSLPDNKLVDCNDKENKPVKRPLKSTYFNTLHLAKKLKTIQEPQDQPKATEKPGQIILEVVPEEASIASSSAMLNGHQAESGQHGSRKMPIATLSNLGNTCFLNSVLYTLRYAPRFLHNLHHLVSELSNIEQKLGSIRLKSSSLGRSAANLASTGTRSWSSKDLLSLGQSEPVQGKSKIQIDNKGSDLPSIIITDNIEALLRLFDEPHMMTLMTSNDAQSKGII